MSDSREKLRAIFFAFVMVTSIVAAGVVGFAGTAAADSTVTVDTNSELQSAITNANSNASADADTIIVQQNVSTDYDAFSIESSNITVRAAPESAPVIDGDSTGLIPGAIAIDAGVSDVTIEGLQLRTTAGNPAISGTAGPAPDPSKVNITIRDNTIEANDTGQAIFIKDLNDSQIVNNNIIANSSTSTPPNELIVVAGERSFSAGAASENVDITGNTFQGDVSRNAGGNLGNPLEVEANNSTISNNDFSSVNPNGADIFVADAGVTTVNGETDANAQRQALVGSNTGVASVNLASVSETTSQSTDDVTDEAAQINVSVSDPVGVDESTIDVNVTGAGSTTNLVVNGTATDNVTATGSNATFDNDANDSVENINVTAQLPEDTTGYDIGVSADDTTGSSIVDTTQVGGSSAFTVDMAGDALQVTADSNNAFANADGDAPAADETANVSVTAIDRFGNELNVSDGNINVNSSDIALTSQDGSVSINGPTSGNATRNNATTFNISDTEVETVTLTALDTNATDETLTRGSTEQTFVADIAGLNVTTDDSTLPADGTTEAAVTAQLVDSNGDAVPRGGISVSYSIDNSSAAGVGTPDTPGQSDTTNANGAATINITADTAGELVTVTAIDQGTGNGFTGETQIETIPGEVSADDSEFRLNGNLATAANDPTVQVATDHNVSVRVEDNSTNPIAGQDVTYTLNGTELATVPSNDQGFANVTDITLPEEKGEFVLNASAGAFNASATGAAQVNITTTAAEITELQFGSDQQTTFAADSGSNTVTIEAADQFGNVNNTDSGTVTFESGDTDVFDFGGSASDTADFSDGTATLSNLNAGSSSGQTTISATIPDSNIQNTTATFTVGEPTGINVTFTNAVSTSSNSNTNDTATLQAQLTSGGSNIGIGDETVSFARISGSAAELNQSGQSFEAETDDTGLATFQVNATSSTGQTTFLAQSENFSASGEGTITTTGAASTVNVAAENSTVTANETTNLTVSFVDSEGRIVPRIDNIGLSADLGTVEDPTNPETSFNSAGEATASTSYNATGGAGEATIQGLGGGVAGSTTITVEEAQQQEPSVSVNFNDQSVQNGTEEVTVDSANFTRADGSAGDYVVVVHVVNDTEFNGGLDNSISTPVGASGNLSNGAENITVDLNSSAAFEDDDELDTLSENVTLRAMLHTTANDSAFGNRLGNVINGIEPGDEIDDANITVTEDAQPQNPVIVGDSPATNTDDDALLEDVNGDGERDFQDAIDLAFNVDAASENVDAFDFDEDGDVDFDDAIALAFE